MTSKRTQAFAALGYRMETAAAPSPHPGYSSAAYTVFHRMLFGKPSRTFTPPSRSRKHRGGR